MVLDLVGGEFVERSARCSEGICIGVPRPVLAISGAAGDAGLEGVALYLSDLDCAAPPSACEPSGFRCLPAAKPSTA